jgi:hypothetical protein
VWKVGADDDKNQAFLLKNYLPKQQTGQYQSKQQAGKWHNQDSFRPYT